MFIKKSILLIGIAWFVQACDSNELEFENQGELAVLEVEPKYATAGDYIQLVGKGFTRDAKVKIGGSQISDFELVSASSIVIKVPTGQAGLSKIQVEQYGLKQSIEYFYLQTPGEAGEETVGTPDGVSPTTDSSTTVDQDFIPVIVGADNSHFCEGYLFYDSSGELQTGTRNCAGNLPAYCDENGQFDCIVTENYRTLSSEEYKVIKDIDEVSFCDQDGDIDCVASASFPAVDTSGLSDKVLVGTSVARIPGT